MRSPGKLYIDANRSERGRCLYAHIPVMKLVIDSNPVQKPWYCQGHVSIWGKDQQPPYPSVPMIEHIQMLFKKITKDLGREAGRGKYLAFRVRLHTIPWNEADDKHWNFGISHDYVRIQDKMDYNNDFLKMVYELKEELADVCGLYLGRNPWDPHLRIKLFAEMRNKLHKHFFQKEGLGQPLQGHRCRREPKRGRSASRNPVNSRTS